MILALNYLKYSKKTNNAYSQTHKVTINRLLFRAGNYMAKLKPVTGLISLPVIVGGTYIVTI
jgi:hypothetical protein